MSHYRKWALITALINLGSSHAAEIAHWEAGKTGPAGGVVLAGNRTISGSLCNAASRRLLQLNRQITPTHSVQAHITAGRVIDRSPYSIVLATSR